MPGIIIDMALSLDAPAHFLSIAEESDNLAGVIHTRDSNSSTDRLLCRESPYVEQFMLRRHNFNTILSFSGYKKLTLKKKTPDPNPNGLTLTLFQFKVEQFEVVFWRHDMNCCTYSESLVVSVHSSKRRGCCFGWERNDTT